MSDEVEDSDGVMYSVEAARSKLLRFEQEQVTLWMPEGLVLTVVAALFWFAAVRSQCLLMNRGMSEKARKRCVLICALGSLLAGLT
jgi:sensor c-di-GMP phosphodiesterase-like protein